LITSKALSITATNSTECPSCGPSGLAIDSGSRVLRRAAFSGFSKELVYRLARETNVTAIGFDDRLVDRSGSVIDPKIF
jgi:hypothetical protein